MGDFFSEVVIFLEEYYVYVIGVGLIIILMLIGLLASKKKDKKASNDGETMANINDVNTGSINDVASTLQNNVMQPVDVVTFPEQDNIDMNSDMSAPVAPVFEPTSTFDPIATEPVAPAAVPVSNMPNIAMPVENETLVNTDVTTPTVNDVFIDNTNIVTPIAEESKPVEEITPVGDDKFDKTEIIDFSSLEPETPAEVKPTEFTPFVVDTSQFVDTDNILNGEISSTEEPKM